MKMYLLIITLMSILISSCRPGQKKVSDNMLMLKALQICENNIILDSHIDWPERIYSNPADISIKTENGDFDFVRARSGGLNAAFSVIFINSEQDVQNGREMFDSMYKLIATYPEKYPNLFGFAYKPDEVKNNFQKGILSVPLCLENGSPIGNDLQYLETLKDIGIVYITLCHDHSNQISDSNFDTNRPWSGLSPFGMEVVAEMNRLGLIMLGLAQIMMA